MNRTRFTLRVMTRRNAKIKFVRKSGELSKGGRRAPGDGLYATRFLHPRRYLFPNVNAWNSNTRSSEFCRRCRMLGMEGRCLHSYRYAWAQRARAAGMPQREAMHLSKHPC